MKDILTYALGVVVCSGFFTLFYRTVMHRHTSFRTGRWFLPVSLAVAAVIPALKIPVWRVAPVEVPLVQQTFELPAIMPQAAPVPTVDWLQVALWALYGFGIAVLAVAMALQFVRIARIRRRSDLYSTGGCRIAVSGEIDTPFSFLETVFIERGTPDDQLRQIVLHEASHIRHRHSHEKIAMEMLKGIQWFNPFAWWAARLLSEVHEFEADRDVLDGGFTVEEYLPLIFRQIFGYNPELSVGLGDSLTKKRFLMMKNKMKLTRYSRLRVAGVLPLAAAGMMLFSFTSRPPEIIYTEVPATIGMAVETVAPISVPQEPKKSEVIDVVRNDSAPAAPAPAQKPQEPQKPQKPEDIPVFNAEMMPTFQGGDMHAFRAWIQERIVYPKEAVEKNITGKVTLKFIIERDGSLTNIEEIASPAKILTDEAMRVMSLSPKWTPGTQKGKSVRVTYIMPIEFLLQKHETSSSASPTTPTPSAAPTPSAVPEAAVPPTEGKIMVVSYGTDKKPADIKVYTDYFTIVDGKTGTTTLNGTPLLIFDGKEITGEQMNALDPNTIKSISVLKDASATATYGERGKDGVIIITSKKAGDGTTTVLMKSEKEGDGTTTVLISADGGTPMEVIKELKQGLREANVTRVTYTTADGKTVTEEIK